MHQDWYSLSTEDVIKNLKSNLESGLSDKEAKNRIQIYGKNTIEKKFEIKPVKIFLRQLKDIFIIILIFATIISLFLGDLEDTILVFAYVVVAILIGFSQEFKAEKSIHELKKLTTDTAIVIRDGNKIEIDTREIVPGDILLLNIGDIIPADARILESLELSIDESILTGESKPVKKTPGQIEEKVPLPDRINMVFSGTTVVFGRGKAIVTETGLNTQIGNVATLVKMGKPEAPLKLQIDILESQVLIVTVFSCIFIIIISLLHGQKLSNILFSVFALAITVIPEVLPIMLTIVLAISIRRMAKRNAIVKKLTGIESLGNIDIICSDKTGTLTKNEMTVREIYTNKIINISGVGYVPTGEFLIDGKQIQPLQDDRLNILLKTGLMCNNASLNSMLGKYWVIGSPTEGALIVAARKAGIQDMRIEKDIVLELPFTSEKKIMITVFKKDEKISVYSKGAPEALLKKCKFEYPKLVLTEKRKSDIINNFRRMESKGLRTIAIAYKTLNKIYPKTLDEDLIFLGLVGMIDPPREEVKITIRYCKEIGIDLKIVTGDSLLVTEYVAREAGLNIKKVLTGHEIDNLSDEELETIIEDVTIFARTTPEQKFRIVNLLKKKGHKIAVTGDGINDAPALNTADIGIAMGMKGTDVARETSDIVLLDDNLTAVINAIEEGRRVYENLRNCVVYLLSTGLAQILIILTTILSNLPFIFTVAQIFWINLVTQGIPALGLAFETSEKDLLKRKIINPKEGLLTPSILYRTIGLGLFMGIIPFVLFMYNYNKGLDVARTVAYNTIIFFALFNILNCRSSTTTNYKLGFLSNKIVILLVLMCFVFQFVMMNIGFFETFFNLVSLNLNYQIFMILIASSILFLGEVKKSSNEFRWLPF